MRFPMHNLAFTMLAATITLPAQDAWAAWQARQRDRGGPNAPWLLVLRPQDAQDRWWMQDDRVRRLLATREFQVQPLTDAQGRDLSHLKGWQQEPRWLLLSPDGAQQTEGRGRPSGDRLLADLLDLGLRPRWERREAFLKEHPDHGPACIEALQEAEALLENRLNAQAGGIAPFLARLRTQPPDPAALTQLDAMARELSEALQHLARLPLWWEQGSLPLFRWGTRPDFVLPPQLREAIDRLREQAWEALLQDPSDEALWGLCARLARTGGLDLEGFLASAAPAPGQAWPPDTLVMTLAESYAAKEDWAGQLVAMNALRSAAIEAPADREAWDEARHALALVEIHRARALARLGRWEESAGAVGEARFLSGQRWRGFLTFFLRRAIPEAFGEQRAVYEPFLDGDPLPDPPPPPAPPTLRLLRLGAPAWAAAWTTLPRTAELAPWGPSELVAETASADLERTLRARHGWEGPRWVLLAGDQLLASGDGVPAARELAQRLAVQAPSRLQRLDRFLERHPAHRAARRLRLDLLRARMPNRHLEPQLAEDARLLRARVKAGDGWTPDPGLWQWTAQQVLPALEADLEHWPDQAGLWRSWVAWAGFHPRQPSALLLARRLPLYGVEAAWSSRLPAEVHKAVAEELRGPGRYEEMRQWFQSAWDGIDRLNRRRGIGVPQWLRSQRRGLKEAIVDPLREALVALRRDAEVVALDREVAEWLGLEGGNR